MGDYRRVLARAAGLAKSANLPLQYALAECNRAYSFVYDDQFDSARVNIAVARAAIANDGRSADAVVESSCLAAEGNLLVATGEADSAIVLLRRAVELSATVVRGGHLGRMNDLALALRAAGRTREATDQQRRIVSELDSTGYRRTDGFPNALGYLASGLWELGELTEVDSILRKYVRADEATYGPGNTEPFIGFMYGLGKLRLGALDSADHWFAITLKDTTASPNVRLVHAPPALTQLRLEQGELAKARDAFATLPTGTHTRRVTAALLGARLRNAEGDPPGALRMLDSSLRALAGVGPTPPANMAQALTTAAEWHLAAGDARGADSLAQLAHLATARDAAQRAAEALAVGYGASSAKAREGKAMLDSLRN